MITTMEHVGMEPDEFVKLQNAMKLKYRTEMISHLVSELHSLICNTQSKEIVELSLDATQSFNKLFAAIEKNQIETLYATVIEVKDTNE